MTELPLSARVPRPTSVEHPADRDGIVWRAATMDDVPGIQACEAQIAVADHPNYTTTVEELEEDFDHSYVDLPRDTVVALDCDEVVAWGLVLMPPGQETLVRVILIGGVRPSHRGRGLGRRLMSWLEARGMQRLAGSDKTLPGWLMAYAEERAESTNRLIVRFGFTPARYFLELRRSLDEPITQVPLDLAIVPFDRSLSERVRVARNDAFRDHWGSQPTNEEQWDSFVSRSTFRPDLCALAMAGDEVVGFVIVTVTEEDWPGQGFSSAYIELVGVPRAWRGRGIAPAVLARSLKLMADAGLEKAVLDVDSDSPTGALGLYTGLGFVESNRSINYNRVY
jgi:mycothiol synthase